jgi:hypothetical protein
MARRQAGPKVIGGTAVSACPLMINGLVAGQAASALDEVEDDHGRGI